jgi:NADH dehydrogenase FAD-containing subunit
MITTAQSGRFLHYDAVSFDIGSETGIPDLIGANEFGIKIKPLEAFVHFIDRLDETARIIVVGGGASGVELSLSLQSRKREHSPGNPVTLVSSGDLLGAPKNKFTSKLNHMVRCKGVQFHLNDSVTEVQDGYVRLASGLSLPFDHLLWLTGPKAPDLFEQSGYKVRDGGYLLVTQTLQSVDFSNVFGAGDCIAIDHCPPLPKAGVYAVRESKVLWRNLNRFFAGQSLHKYQPQSRYLSLISTGNQEALFIYGNSVFKGKWCWELKCRIDKWFMKKYQ